MSKKKKIYKPRPVSGFPEWLPEERRAEQAWFDHIRRVFESYGFCNIETPSVEELDAINAKGGDGGADVDKEVYVIERLHKEEGDREARLALHFDQTVPLARYTAQHFNDLVFPFKRYQMQRVWRGERPQAGRFREFYQCDIDVINVDTLPLHFDAEMPAIMWEILSSLPGMENENIQIRISNRKILIGFIEDWGANDIDQILRILDKLEKTGEQETWRALQSTGASAIAEALIRLSQIKAKSTKELLEKIKNTGENIHTQNYTQGIEELSFVMNQLAHLPEGAVVADLSIVRGLDYYTGTVYETVFVDDPNYGSICSGGRYDDLAGNYINKHLPGVGISIGFSRLFDRIRTNNKLPKLGISPAQILIVAEDEEKLKDMNAAAHALRAAGQNIETWHRAENKLKRPLAYAEKKGIRYMWLLPNGDRETHEIKDMVERTQKPTTIEEWTNK